MTIDDLKTLPDGALEQLYKEVVRDLEKAEKNTPWHDACFATYCLVIEESKRRVIEGGEK